MMAQWTDDFGREQEAQVVSLFIEKEIEYIVIRVFRGVFEKEPPFAVMRRDDVALVPSPL